MSESSSLSSDDDGKAAVGTDASLRASEAAPRMTGQTEAMLRAAVDAVRKRVDAKPEIALILGSGLGDLADAVEDATTIGTADIPHYPRSTVAGHSGRLVFGTRGSSRRTWNVSFGPTSNAGSYPWASCGLAVRTAAKAASSPSPARSAAFARAAPDAAWPTPPPG